MHKSNITTSFLEKMKRNNNTEKVSLKSYNISIVSTFEYRLDLKPYLSSFGPICYEIV